MSDPRHDDPQRPLSDPTLRPVPPEVPRLVQRDLAHEVEGQDPLAVRVLALNRLPLNRLDLETIRHLGAALERTIADGKTDVVVLRGAPEAAGFAADLEPIERTPDRLRVLLTELAELAQLLLDTPVVSVALVHGECAGVGVDILSACDVVIAEREARFRLPELRAGSLPTLLPLTAARVGFGAGGRAWLNALLTGSPFSADAAQRMGLVTQLAGPGELDRALSNWLDQVGAASPAAVKLARIAAAKPLRAAADLANHARLIETRLLPLDDATAGPQAAADGRTHRWQDRSPAPDLDSPE